MNHLLENKRITFDYELLENFEAGIELLGHEVKALRAGLGSLIGAYILIRGGEAFLIGATIPPYQPNNTPADYDQTRPRRLLLTKKEIRYLAGRGEQKGLTIAPISLYNKGRKIKVAIAIVRGRKKYDKREKIKKRESEREIKRTLKNIR
jgi:SsrA-binding protein